MITKFKLSDMIVIAAVLLLAVMMMIGSYRKSGGVSAIISSDDGKTIVSLDKNSEGSIESCGYYLSYSVNNGSIRVTECTCPEKVCVKTGSISKQGRTIVCLPAHIIITITGGEIDDPSDIIAG